MTNLLSRLRSTTSYTGQARRHDYSLTVRHSPWRTRASALTIDAVEHIPSDSSPESEQSSPAAVSGAGADNATDDAEDRSNADDPTSVEVRISGWLSVRIKVRRPTVKGTMVDREEIYVNSAALSGAGEVEVHAGQDIVPLLPEPGSRSEARDRKRSARPTLFALIAGITTALRLVVPLLGFGALLAFITEPLKAWLSRHLSPVLDPIFAWLGQILEPVGRVLATVGRFIGQVIHFLFGWLPSFQLPFDIPDWVWTSSKIALLALLAFSVSRSNLKRRQKQLEDVRLESRGASH